MNFLTHGRFWNEILVDNKGHLYYEVLQRKILRFPVMDNHGTYKHMESLFLM